MKDMKQESCSCLTRINKTREGSLKKVLGAAVTVDIKSTDCNVVNLEE
jgi:hypothetical protein